MCQAEGVGQRRARGHIGYVCRSGDIVHGEDVRVIDQLACNHHEIGLVCGVNMSCDRDWSEGEAAFAGVCQEKRRIVRSIDPFQRLRAPSTVLMAG